LSLLQKSRMEAAFDASNIETAHLLLLWPQT
jgi:hypothetical protein